MKIYKLPTLSLAAFTAITMASILALRLHPQFSIYTQIIFALIPLISIPSLFLRSRFIFTLQLLYYTYATLSFLLPIFTSAYIPEVLTSIRSYSQDTSSNVNWINYIFLDLLSVQLGIYLGVFGIKNRHAILAPIRIKRSGIILVLLTMLTLLFRFYLQVGVNNDGEFGSNPLARAADPLFLANIIVIQLAATSRKISKQTHVLATTALLVLLVSTVILGSRSGLFYLCITALVSKLLNLERIRIKKPLQSFAWILILVGALLASFFVATILRSASLDTSFANSDTLAKGFVISIVKRVGLHEDIYQLANGLDSQTIYDFSNPLQVILSSIDLILPGTFFPDMLPQAALNLIWFYKYPDVNAVVSDWASIAVPISAINILYFEYIIGFVVNAVAIAIYIRIASWMIYSSPNPGVNYAGVYALSSFYTFFLSSMGYEYLIRHLLTGAAFTLFWFNIVKVNPSKSRQIVT